MIYALAFLSIFVVLYVCGRHDEDAVRESWSDLVCPRAAQATLALESQIQADAASLGYAHQATGGTRRLRADESLLHDVRLVAAVVARIVGQRVHTLRGMRVCSRMLAAVLPQGPLPGAELRLPEAALVGRAGAGVHAVIVGTASRFRWRAQVSMWLYGLVGRATTGTADALAMEGLGERAWRRFDDGVGDVATLDAHHLETVRAFASSLEIFQRHGAPVDSATPAGSRQV